MKKPTTRFTQTVQNYMKYRPDYPAGVLDTLITECELTLQSVIADIGSGTGLLTKILLDNGNRVFGIEPNAAMRQAGEEYLKSYLKFTSINATAENTSLPEESIDIITSGTAFHWFDPLKTKLEFQRILKPGGWVVLIWNVRDVKFSFMNDYEKLITEFSTDHYESEGVSYGESVEKSFFSPQPMRIKAFPHHQTFDWEGLKGRLLSCSYAPTEQDSTFSAMIDQLKLIFDRHQKNETVEFSYVTKLFYGQLK